MPNFDRGARGNGNGKRKPAESIEVQAVQHELLPAINEPKCHVCQSPLRHEIDRLIVRGVSYAKISQSLDGTISRQSLSRHDKEHLNYKDAALRQIAREQAESLQANIEEGVKGQLARLVFLQTALHKGIEYLQTDNMILTPRDVVQIIQELEKFDNRGTGLALEEVQAQFQAIVDAVQEIVGPDKWNDIIHRAEEIYQRAGNAGALGVPIETESPPA